MKKQSITKTYGTYMQDVQSSVLESRFFHGFNFSLIKICKNILLRKQELLEKRFKTVNERRWLRFPINFNFILINSISREIYLWVSRWDLKKFDKKNRWTISKIFFDTSGTSYQNFLLRYQPRDRKDLVNATKGNLSGRKFHKNTKYIDNDKNRSRYPSFF